MEAEKPQGELAAALARVGALEMKLLAFNDRIAAQARDVDLLTHELKLERRAREKAERRATDAEAELEARKAPAAEPAVDMPAPLARPKTTRRRAKAA